jgi:hypothetical protein
MAILRYGDVCEVTLMRPSVEPVRSFGPSGIVSTAIVFTGVGSGFFSCVDIVNAKLTRSCTNLFGKKKSS